MGSRKEVIVEELVLGPESEGDIVAMGLKDVVSLEEELNFKTFVQNSIIDVFYDDFDVSSASLFETDDLFFQKLMQ